MAENITLIGLPNPRTGTGLGSGVEGEDAAMLAAGHWIAAKMPMRAVYPRPDTETQAHARHRMFHSGFRYEIPVGVQGGAWPFLYTLIVAPAGATIGEHYSEDMADRYGVVSWTPSGQTGTHRFTVQVVDQDGEKLTISWTATLNDAGFVFIDSNAVSSGSGTITSPLKTFDDWYKHDINDATYLNRVAVFRGGTYSVIGKTGNGNVEFNLAAKTPSLIGNPDEAAILNCSTSKFYNAVLLNDLYVSHLTFYSGRSDVDDSHFWWLTAVLNRVTFFKNTFDTIGKGLVGNDNPSCVFVSGSGQKENFLMKHNTFVNINNHASNGSYFDFYDVTYFLGEQNLAQDCNVDFGFWAKATIGFGTFRGNIAVDNVQGRQMTFGYSDASAVTPNNHEACYNRLVVPASQTTLPLLEMVSDNAETGLTFNTFLYRNSLVGGNTWVRFTEVDTDANIVYTNDLAKWQLDDQVTAVPNEVRTSPTNFVDTTTGKLIGAGLTSFGGIKGADIA